MTDGSPPLSHLEVFNAVYRLGSVSKAALHLGIPQPTLSRWLTQLRQQFDDPLFVRTRNGLEPTSVAVQIAPGIAEIVAIYRTRVLIGAAFEPARSTRNFRIAASDFGHIEFLPRIYNAIRQEAPAIQLTAVPLGQRDLIDDLEAGKVDIAIGGFPHLLTGVRQQTLLRETYVCAVRAEHPLLARPFDLAAFRSCDHAVVSAHDLYHAQERAETALLGICPPDRIRLVTESFLVSVALAEQTDVVVTLPAIIANWFARRGRLAVVPAPIALPEIEVQQYWHERYDHDPAITWLRRRIATLDLYDP